MWASVYANHGALRTAVGFVHLGGLLLGGGCAVAADLATIAAGRTPSVASQVELQGLERTHRLVAAGLTVVLVSGLLLFAADIDTYWHSRVYWLKMGLVVLLVANGALLVTAERQLQLGHPKGGIAFATPRERVWRCGSSPRWPGLRFPISGETYGFTA